jgi:hypothetical protein
MAKLQKPEANIISFFKKLEDSFNFDMNPGYAFLSNPKQKQLIKLVKIPDTYASLYDHDILVIFNEDYFRNFDEQTSKILMEQEIDRIETSVQDDTIKLAKPRISTSVDMIKKYTLELIDQANKFQENFEKNKKK